MPAQDLSSTLPGPTLLYIEGDTTLAPVFVTTLLHGNETSGWTGLCRFMQTQPKLRRPLIVFVGNPLAAHHHLRHTPTQPDFNRIWRDNDTEYASLTQAVLNAAGQQPLFAAVDLHNNTGRNPHYSVVTSLDAAHLRLAYLFSSRAVLVEEPDTVLSRALQSFCPSIAVEVGPINDPQSDERAYDLIHRLATQESFATDYPDLQLFRALARVHIPRHIDFAFEAADAPLCLTGGMEAVNFHRVPEGTQFAYTELKLNDALLVLDADHQDVTNQFFYQEGERVYLKRSVVPAMYTTDPEVVLQDCLCYLMEES